MKISSFNKQNMDECMEGHYKLHKLSLSIEFYLGWHPLPVGGFRGTERRFWRCCEDPGGSRETASRAYQSQAQEDQRREEKVMLRIRNSFDRGPDMRKYMDSRIKQFLLKSVDNFLRYLKGVNIKFSRVLMTSVNKGKMSYIRI